MIPLDPKLAKKLAEEHERELLDEVEADRLAKDEIPNGSQELETEDYEPVTDSNHNDAIRTRKHNPHIHDEK